MRVGKFDALALIVAAATTFSFTSVDARAIETRSAVNPAAAESDASIRSSRERPRSTGTPVRVRNIRLEASPPVDEAESATLKFDVHNESLRNLASMVLSISLVEAPRDGSVDAVPTVLVGPVKVLATRLLLPGYTVHYELRLRNISSDCGCVPTVDVLEARFEPEDEPEH